MSAPQFTPGQKVAPRSESLARFAFLVTDVVQDEGEYFYRANDRDWLAEHMLRSVDDATPDASPAPLSQSQYQVLFLLREGLSNVEIAREMRISHRTVKGHIGSAVRRLGLNTEGKSPRIVLVLSLGDVRKPLPTSLSPKRRAVGSLVCMGFTYPEIARRLKVTRFLVQKQVSEVFDATGCWSKLELAARYQPDREIAEDASGAQ